MVETYQVIQHAYPREVWVAKEMEPIQFPGWTKLPPGSYRLVLHLRNTATGRELHATQQVVVAD